MNDVIAVYCSLIRSILEYACPVWHCGLTKGQSDEIEGVQRRCLKILFPDLSYKDALQITGLELLSIGVRVKCVNYLTKLNVKDMC